MSKRIPADDTGVYSRLELLRRIAVLVILIIVIIAFIGLLVIVTIQLTPKIDSLSDFLFTTVLVVSLLLGITIHFLRSDSVQRSIEKAINSNLPVPIQEPFLKFLNKLTKDNS